MSTVCEKIRDCCDLRLAETGWRECYIQHIWEPSGGRHPMGIHFGVGVVLQIFSNGRAAMHGRELFRLFYVPRVSRKIHLGVTRFSVDVRPW